MKKFLLSFAVVAILATTAVVAQDNQKQSSEKAKTECTKAASADKKCCKDSEKKCDKKCEKKCADKETASADSKCCSSKKATAENKSAGKK